MNKTKSERVKIFTLPTQISKEKGLVKSGRPNLHPVTKRGDPGIPFLELQTLSRRCRIEVQRFLQIMCFSYLNKIIKTIHEEDRGFPQISLHFDIVRSYHKQLCKRPETSWRGSAPVVCKNSEVIKELQKCLSGKNTFYVYKDKDVEELDLWVL